VRVSTTSALNWRTLPRTSAYGDPEPPVDIPSCSVYCALFLDIPTLNPHGGESVYS